MLNAFLKPLGLSDAPIVSLVAGGVAGTAEAAAIVGLANVYMYQQGLHPLESHFLPKRS
jgi:hypothetical protein